MPIKTIIPCTRGSHQSHDLVIELFSSAAQLPARQWDECVEGASLFLSRNYLRALELSQEPQLCAVFKKENRVVGVASFQVAEFKGAPLKNYLNANRSLVQLLLRPLSFLQKPIAKQMVVCGSQFAAGEHGYHFSANIPEKCKGAALAEAAKMAKKELSKTTAPWGILLKEFFPSSRGTVHTLEQHQYTSFSTEPSMFLTIDHTWHTLDDYLSSLASKYRVKAKRAMTLSSGLRVRDLQLTDISLLRDEINLLYSAVVARAHNKLGGMSPHALYHLRQYLGDDLVLKGYFLNDKLVGFLMGFVNGDILEAGFVGIDYQRNKTNAIYCRMLYDYLQEAMSRNLKAVNYGRTAGEIKSTIGAVPVPVSCCVHMGCQTMDSFLPMISRKIKPASFPLRKPFKKIRYSKGQPEFYCSATRQYYRRRTRTESMTFIEGYSVGLAMLVFIGPVLFVLLEVSVTHGRLPGLAAATGILVSDVIAVALCLFGFTGFLTTDLARAWFGIAGGTILMGLCVQYLFFKKTPLPTTFTSSISSLSSSFAKGFLVNFVNPFVFLVWLGVIAGATMRHGMESERIIFLSGTITAVFTMDVFKVFLAQRVRRIMKPGALVWIFRASGVLMGAFGIRLVCTGLV